MEKFLNQKEEQIMQILWKLPMEILINIIQS